MLTTMPEMNDFLMWPTKVLTPEKLELVQVVNVEGDIFHIREVKTFEDLGRGYSFTEVKERKSLARLATDEEMRAGWAESVVFLLKMAHEAERQAKVARAKSDEACRAAENFLRRFEPMTA